jgi:hypothetical protein
MEENKVLEEGSERRLKVEIELHFTGDGRTYLNFWNYENGDDVIAEIKDGKLFMYIDELETEVTLKNFIDEIKSKFIDPG